MNMPQISIIVPVYNTEKYINKCIDSIIGQTYKDWELILVDDGSPDHAGDICDEYALKDSRIRVIHKKNGGVSSARNAGLEAACGRWIYFCDSDDYLFDRSLQILASGLSDDVEMSLAGYTEVSPEGEVLYSVDAYRKEILSLKDIFVLYFSPSEYKFQGYLVNRLFSNEIIQRHNLRFNENIYYKEDGLFIVQYLCQMKKKACYTTESVYNYVIHPGSAMTNALSGVSAKFLTNLDARILSLNVIETEYPEPDVIALAKRSVFDFGLWVIWIMRQNRKINHRILLGIYSKIISSIGLISFGSLMFKKIIK